MDEFPYSFSPVICDDCGRQDGQFFRDTDFDDGDLLICIDCLMERQSQWQNEQERDEANENEDEALQPVTDPNYSNPDIDPEG